MSACGAIQPVIWGSNRHHNERKCIFLFNTFSNRLYEKALKKKMLRVQKLRGNRLAGWNPQIGGRFEPAK